MKKLLISLLSLVALNVFALDSLIQLHQDNIKAGTKYWNSINKIVKDNPAVLAKNFDSFKKSDDAKFSNLHLLDSVEIEKANALTKEQRTMRGLKQHMYMQWFSFYPNEELFTSMSKRAQLIISTSLFHRYEIVNNPTYYSELKSDDFKVEGVKLPLWSINALAKYNNDWEYFASLDINSTIVTERSYIVGMSNWLLSTNNYDAALDKCKQIISKIILRGYENSSELKRYRSIQAELIARKINANLTK
jgi:hypothetical protein